MKEDFEKFYDKCLQDDELFTEWEQVKAKKSKRSKIASIVVIIIDILIIYFANKYFGIIGTIQNFGIFGLISCLFIIFGILFIDVLTIAIFGIRVDSKYNTLYKEKVINELFKNFFNEVDYIPKKTMPESIYREPRYEEYDEYNSDDYMESLINDKYSMKMADVKTVDVETTTDSDGNTTTTRTTIFSGVFAKIDVKKSINNELRIKQDRTINKKNRLEMDSDEFEKYFDVSSTDEIIGMRLLTHDIMDLLTNYRIKLKKPFDIVIKENIMYIRLHIGSMFEAKFNKKEFIDKDSLESYYDMVNFIYDLSKQIIKVVEETEI